MNRAAFYNLCQQSERDIKPDTMLEELKNFIKVAGVPAAHALLNDLDDGKLVGMPYLMSDSHGNYCGCVGGLLGFHSGLLPEGFQDIPGLEYENELDKFWQKAGYSRRDTLEIESASFGSSGWDSEAKLHKDIIRQGVRLVLEELELEGVR